MATASVCQSTCIKRLQKELTEMTFNPPPNCSAGPKDDNIFEWVGSIQGPLDSVYEGGTFLIEIKFTPDYPFKPPRVVFKTRIYHCNINSQGLVCLDILQQQWTPALNTAKVLLSLTCLLQECNPRDPLVSAIARQYMHDREEHDRIARLWTQRYAK